MGKRSREKGAQAERAAASILQVLYPGAQRRCSGEESQDDQRGRDLKGTPGLCVQVKETGSPTPLAALSEAECAAKGSADMPVALVRQARLGASTPFRVVLSLESFVRLMASRIGEDPEAAVFRLRMLAENDAAMRARIG